MTVRCVWGGDAYLVPALTSHPPALSALRCPIANREGLELRELRHFAILARSGNFGRAAQELKISQPTLSHQIRKLEDALGTQLLVRHARGVTLTQAGSCLLDRLDTIIHLLAAPLHQEGEEAVHGTVSLAMPAEVAPLLVPPLIAAFHERWPRVTLDVKEAPSGTLEAWAVNGRVDIALVQDPPDLDALCVEPLLSENLGLVAAPCTRVARTDAPVRLRELAEHKLILPRAQHWIARRLTSAAFQRGVRIEPAFQVDSLALIKEMVRSLLGCTVLPCMAVRDELARGTLVFRPIEQPTLCATHAIAFRQTTTEPELRGFVDVIRDVVMALAKDGTWKGARIARPETNDCIALSALDLAPRRAPVADAAFRAMELAGD
jgi:LysR family transcriptional regulator, nitrogen assimilation regulatory protein